MILFAENLENIKKQKKKLPAIPVPRDNPEIFFSVF